MNMKKVKNQLKLTKTKNDKKDIKRNFSIFIHVLAAKSGGFSNLAKLLKISRQQINRYVKAEDLARPGILFRIMKHFPEIKEKDIDHFSPPHTDWKLIKRIEELKEKESKSK